LANGIGKVNNGAETLSKASGQVSEGIEKLDNGAETLSEGEKKFYDEGISKIQKELDEKLGDTLDRLKLLQSDDVTYDSYSGKADDMESHVKFIIETEGVEKASA
jgi:putative membrane protein